ncbi:PAS domain-containing protein [Rhodocytophaga aerolata]|uniref:PAS domain-containing protein n=1 Tax=Rhodocytophaga aerolata TaxID=455078 RepID=A0ABT8RIT1_9BACT|nr:PAS domain-containing protein [Rhodocytophaga aerolata]MDO1451269.1 PAS domain-containing protein [Rhodocytophaga aerolata]
MIQEQKLLTESRLKKLLIFETIGENTALAELEFRSYILFEGEEFIDLRKKIWQNKLIPSMEELQALKSSFTMASHQKLIDQLLINLTTFRQLQEENQKKAKTFFAQVTTIDSLGASSFKEASALAATTKQRVVFEAIKEATATISADQRVLIQKESIALTDSMETQQKGIIFLILCSIVFASLLSYQLIQATIIPLTKVSKYLQELSLGKLPEQLDTPANEIGVMMRAINTLVSHLKASAQFATCVGEGKYTSNYKPASREDTLGNSLVTMQEKLSQIEREDNKRNWCTEGFAKFSELLRTEEGNTKLLSEKLICALVKYVGANQGGVFMINDVSSEDIHLELIACYAFNRKKFLEKRIEMGEGLVGQAIREEDTVYLTDVPSEYIHITSGLGGATPKSILIVPLKVNNKVYGALELASFSAFESYQIAFIEKLSESIASTISSVKINEQTRHLLEVAQQQAEEMRAQEEEMRQNMEELEAIQEEIKRKSAEMESQLTAIDSAMATIEFTIDGTIIRANDKFLELMGYSLGEIQGKHHRMFVEATYGQSSEYHAFWKSLHEGHPQIGDFGRITKHKEEVWLKASYTPAYDSHGNIYKIIKFAQDITLQRKLSMEIDQKSEQMSRIISEIEAQTNIVNSIAIVSKTDLQGNITYVNEQFLKWSKYSREEVLGNNHRFLKSGDQEDKIFEELWKTISSGKVFRGQIKNKAKDGTFYWVDAIIAPILDERGKPKEYIAQRFVINEVKEKEAQLSQAMEQAQTLEKRIRQHMQQSPEKVVYITNTKGEIEWVNEEFTIVTGYSEAEVWGKTAHQLLQRQQVGPHAGHHQMEKALRAKTGFKETLQGYSKAGETLLCEINLSPLPDRKGEVDKFISTGAFVKHVTEKNN